MTDHPVPAFQIRVNGVIFYAGFSREREGSAARLSIRFEDSKGNARSTFFNNIGDGDWKEFLVSLDDDYIGDRLFAMSRRVPDHAKTRNSIRSFVRELRRDGDLSKDAAMRIEEILRQEAREFLTRDIPSLRRDRSAGEPDSVRFMISRVDQVLQSAGVHMDGPMGLVQHRDAKTFTAFMRKVWSPIMDMMRRDIGLEKLKSEEHISSPAP